MRTDRLRLTLGKLRLRRLIRRQRRLSRALSLADMVPRTQVPKALTGVRVPLLLKRETAMRLRDSLADQILLEERMVEGMDSVQSSITTALGRPSRWSRTVRR